jgi:hypothetical protein
MHRIGESAPAGVPGRRRACPRAAGEAALSDDAASFRRASVLHQQQQVPTTSTHTWLSRATHLSSLSASSGLPHPRPAAPDRLLSDPSDARSPPARPQSALASSTCPSSRRQHTTQPRGSYRDDVSRPLAAARDGSRVSRPPRRRRPELCLPARRRLRDVRPLLAAAAAASAGEPASRNPRGPAPI